MGLTVVSSTEQERREREALEAGAYTLDRRYVLTDEGKLEPEETASGSFFGGPGRQLSLEDARRYGLLATEPPTKAADPAEDKAETRERIEDKGSRRKGR